MTPSHRYAAIRLPPDYASELPEEGLLVYISPGAKRVISGAPHSSDALVTNCVGLSYDSEIRLSRADGVLWVYYYVSGYKKLVRINKSLTDLFEIRMPVCRKGITTL